MKHWQEMITLNLYPDVNNNKQLKTLADNIIVLYQKYGRIISYLNNTKKPDNKAEYIIIAVLGNDKLFETVVSSIRLDQEQAVGIVYSHRAYGKAEAQTALKEWIPKNISNITQAIITWENPSPAAIKALPQSAE